MIRLQTFSLGAGVFYSKKTHNEIEDFLNQVGQENIIYFTCSGDPGAPFNYTIVYNDGTWQNIWSFRSNIWAYSEWITRSQTFWLYKMWHSSYRNKSWTSLLLSSVYLQTNQTKRGTLLSSWSTANEKSLSERSIYWWAIIAENILLTLKET